ncbi:MAG: cobyrinate a,c-diamide synthase [Pseudomonadota bacterium]
MTTVVLPRLMIAGLAGNTGKSFVSMGIVRALRARGLHVAPFKKGPDFIDAAWLGEAAGVAGRNLDTFIMPEEAILGSLRRAAAGAPGADIAVIEGNRGLFDGLDASGTHSSAQLARVTGTPVVLVIDTTKATRTVAALVLGCRSMDPSLDLAGVILNRVGTARQEAIIREVLAAETGIPVLGAIPRISVERLPSRHLGLVTPAEHPDVAGTLEELGDAVDRHVDIDALLNVAGRAEALPGGMGAEESTPAGSQQVRIGVLKDPAFSFYYPENLEALEEAGAALTFISPAADGHLPSIDALYIGGGFPEEHLQALSSNADLRDDLKKHIADGLPVWAECGGLMYLSRGVRYGAEVVPMVGALPITVEQMQRPQGHGYVSALVDGANPFLAESTSLGGHEFHYSRVEDDSSAVTTVMALQRGVGVGGGRDGIRVGGVVASYTHLHALGTPGWAPGMVRAARGEAA